MPERQHENRICGCVVMIERHIAALAKTDDEFAQRRVAVKRAADVRRGFEQAEVAELVLSDAHAPSADGLAARLRANYPMLKTAAGSNDPAGFDVVVNATPMGMNKGDAMPMDVSRIAPETFVGEVVMKQEMTAFLSAAQARGCPVQVGVDMLFEQIPAYLEFFRLPSTTPEHLRAIARIAY